MTKLRTPSPSSREFTVSGWQVLSPAKRAEHEAQLSRPKPERGTNNTGSYLCPELERTAGIPEDRFAAFQLPSRRGDLLHYPDGGIEPFPESPNSQPKAR